MESMPGKRMVAVIDIDTTIANNDARAELLQKHCVVCGGPKTHEPHSTCPTCLIETADKIAQESWDTFLRPDLMALDKPERKGVEAIRRMRAHNIEFHFITGRNEGLREVTEEWLRQYVGWDPERESLVMRGQADRDTPASVYKERALKRLIAMRDLHDAAFIFFEDDPWVFGTYAKYGICVKCPEGWDYFCPEAARSLENVWNR